MTILPCRNVDPEIFFLPDTVQKAKRLCKTCPALDACFRMTRELEEKLGRQEGVWAGMTVDERRLKYPVVING